MTATNPTPTVREAGDEGIVAAGTHGNNHAALPPTVLLDPGYCDGCDDERVRLAQVWDEGVDAAFRGAITRQNANDVKRRNPYRAALAPETPEGDA